MKVLLSGSSGFIGKYIRKFLAENGYQVLILKRDEYRNPLPKVEKSDIVIHLAGSPILKRWTRKNKNEIIDSRVTTTRNIVEAINLAKSKPKLLISTSAIGIYTSGEEHNESSTKYDKGFLGEVCKAWEHEALRINKETRLAIFRLGIVLGKNGGAFKKMSEPFKIGLGGKIGNGKQPFSWIHIHDLLSVYKFVIENNEIEGIFNLTSPKPITNETFTRTLSKTINKPAFLTVPAFILNLIYGEASQTLTDGAFVNPKKLIKNGFIFEFEELDKALKNICS